MKKYYPEINTARGIGIILVVMGHAFPDASLGVSNQYARIIFDAIYSFHMPLFIFLAGFVASKVVHIKAGGEKLFYIKKRADRLMIPYFVVGLIYLPLKLVLAELSNVPYKFSNLWKILIGENPDYTLWTLWVLFILSIIAVIITTEKNIKIVVLICMGLSVAGCYIPFHIDKINTLIVRAFYYFLGILIALNYDACKRIIFSKKITLITALVLMISGNVFYHSFPEPYAAIVKTITALSGIVIVLCISLFITSGKNSLLERIGGYSMDIYIVSTFVQPVIRIICWSELGMNYFVCTFLSVAGGVTISLILSKHILRKNRLTRRFVLGMSDIE